MKKFIVFILCFLSSLAWSNQIKVLQVVAGPEVIEGEGHKVKVLKNNHLKNELRFKTGQNQFLKIQLGSFYELSILDDSDVFVEQKNPNHPLVSYNIQLHQGQIYIKKISEIKKSSLEQTAELRLQSVFFDWKVPFIQNLDLLVELKNEQPAIRFCQRSGDYEVSLFDHEKKINLKALEGVEFLGALESQKVAYDILLNGRKIPKGHWLEVKTCSFDEIQKKELDFIKMEQLSAQKTQAHARKIKLEKQKADSQFLCRSPYGQLNQCAWVLKTGRCQKTRCNAEGKWTQIEFVSIAEAPSCTIQSYVSQCND